MNNLDIFKGLLFCLHTFGVRRSIDVLDSETLPDPLNFGTGSDPGLYGSQRTADTKSMKLIKKALKVI